MTIGFAINSDLDCTNKARGKHDDTAVLNIAPFVCGKWKCLVLSVSGNTSIIPV